MHKIKEMVDELYKNHPVFTQLAEYVNFYKKLSFSIFGFVTLGTKTIHNIDSYVYSSIQGTLESIRDILIKGRINDAYALLRKYYDSVIINIYTMLYLKDNISIENFVVEKIDKWVKGEEKLPPYRIMSQYIRKSEKVSKLNKLIYQDNRYKNIRDRCNDHIHYNFFRNILCNDNEIYIRNRLKLLDVFSRDLENIFILHFAYIFYVNDHYMMSSDYVDYLDCGLTPEEGSQYWVAPFIQKVFQEVIKKKRNDIAELIKNETTMELL